MKGRIVGIVVLVLIVAAALVWQFGFRKNANIGRRSHGKDGDGKRADRKREDRLPGGREVKTMLRRNTGSSWTTQRRARSRWSAGPCGSDIEFLWPSSQVALELYRMTRDNASVKSDIIFSSPIVLYSWNIVSTPS